MIIVFTGEDLQKYFVYIVAVLPYKCTGVLEFQTIGKWTNVLRAIRSIHNTTYYEFCRHTRRGST